MELKKNFGKSLEYDEVSEVPIAAGAMKALVVVLNETRGAMFTLEPLLETGLCHVEWTLAYCGARQKTGVNPYSTVAKYLWEYDEPADWGEELRAVLPQSFHSFFLDPGAPGGISSTSDHIQLWVSGWIQGIFRLRALEKISSLGLEEHFDWVFLVRSDYVFVSPIVPPRSPVNRGLLFMLGDSYGGLNDRFMGVPSELVQSVRNAVDYTRPNFAGTSDQLFDFLRGQLSQNPETLLWFELNKAGLLEGANYMGQMGFCVRFEQDVSRGSAGFWSRRRGVYLKYPTELLLAKWCASVSTVTTSQTALSLLAKISRAAGAQPRLLLAPMLAFQGEFQLGFEVFLKSKRKSRFVMVQLIFDVAKMFGDLVALLSGRRKWTPSRC